MRDAKHVRVDGNALDLVKAFVHDDVGGLAPHAGELLELLHALRHLAAEIGHDHASAVHAVARLVVVKSDGPDDLLDLVYVSLGHFAGRAPTREQLGSDFVHVSVRGLRG